MLLKKSTYHNYNTLDRLQEGNRSAEFTNKIYPLGGIKLISQGACLPVSLGWMDWLTPHLVMSSLRNCSIFEAQLCQLCQHNSATGACAERLLQGTPLNFATRVWLTLMQWNTWLNKWSEVDGFAEGSCNVCFSEGFCNSLWSKQEDHCSCTEEESNQHCMSLE